MDNVVLIGKFKTIEIFKNDEYIDGELIKGGKIGEVYGIINPMTSKMLKNFEAGKYTLQDQIIYSKDYIDIEQGIYCYLSDKRGKKIKYIFDDIKEWDDCDLIKYLIRRE